jgi:hypothetical protein
MSSSALMPAPNAPAAHSHRPASPGATVLFCSFVRGRGKPARSVNAEAGWIRRCAAKVRSWFAGDKRDGLFRGRRRCPLSTSDRNCSWSGRNTPTGKYSARRLSGVARSHPGWPPGWRRWHVLSGQRVRAGQRSLLLRCGLLRSAGPLGSGRRPDRARYCRL